MKKVYVYYENFLNKPKSTSIYFEVFENYKKAHDFMDKRKNEILQNKDCILDKLETGINKSWLRIWNNENYLDLIIEPKIIKE